MENNESTPGTASTGAENPEEQRGKTNSESNVNANEVMLCKQLRSEFTYNLLFKDGKYSDVIINVLGKQWKLHKDFLCQSPYFASMFSGAWKESNENELYIDVEGSGITEYAVSAAFTSLYTDRLNVDAKEIVPVLAAASFFQIQDLIDKCAKLMTKRIGFDTAATYYNASVTHNIPSVKSAAFQWLETNLTHFQSDLCFLRMITVELMESLVWSKNLIPSYLESEFYTMLKNWLSTQLLTDKEFLRKDFFKTQKWKVPFLDSEQGKKYILIFQALRIKYILLETGSSAVDKVREMISDNIIPQLWVLHAQTDIIESIRLFTVSDDEGPSDLTEERVFERESYRSSNRFDLPDEDGYTLWSDQVFLFGLPLEFIMNQTNFIIKRFNSQDGVVRNHNCTHQIAIKVSFFWLDDKRDVKRLQESELQFLSLEDGDEMTIVTVNEEITYPFIIVYKILVDTPR